MTVTVRPLSLSFSRAAITRYFWTEDGVTRPPTADPAFLVTGILLIWVIPVFADVYKSFGKALPAPTQIVINLSNFTIAHALAARR